MVKKGSKILSIYRRKDKNIRYGGTRGSYEQEETLMIWVQWWDKTW